MRFNLYLLIILSFWAASAHAQYSGGLPMSSSFGNSSSTQLGVGIQGSYARPFWSFKNDYKLGMGFGAFVVANHVDGWIKQRAGLYHTSFSPQADSTYFERTFNNGGTTDTNRGYAVRGKVPLNYLFIDNSFRLFRIKNFSMHGGFGCMIGVYKYTYKEYYMKGGSGNSEDIEDYFGGLRNNISVDYTIAKRFRAYAELTTMITSNTDWSFFTPHNNFALGLVFYFKELVE